MCSGILLAVGFANSCPLWPLNEVFSTYVPLTKAEHKKKQIIVGTIYDTPFSPILDGFEGVDLGKSYCNFFVVCLFFFFARKYHFPEERKLHD